MVLITTIILDCNVTPPATPPPPPHLIAQQTQVAIVEERDGNSSW